MQNAPDTDKTAPPRPSRATHSPPLAPKGQPAEYLRPLRHMMGQLEQPPNLFNGLMIAESPAPDNIIIFERTDTASFRPTGVSNNFHHRFVLVCVLEGGGPGRIGNYTHQFEPGDCALIFPNQFHHFMDVEAQSLHWLFITFEIPQAKALQALLDNPRQLDAEGVILLQNTLIPYFEQKKNRPDALEIAYHLSRFLRYMPSLPRLPTERFKLNSSDNLRNSILERINSYVREHLTDAPTLADLADALGYSVSHLRAVFRDHLGVSLGLYIRESRLSEAAKLLQESNLSVTEISEKTGFDSLFAFSRAFKKAYGIPPKAYSQKVGRSHEAGKSTSTQSSF
ncbi:helix-turn-helix transcriptional regulator [Coraliomargarita parva]|uniref:helix-turn-helix transcriptional regulator n=1 Tax=Coraliomargarita parva TaxID=3014050 RepID=UPI0022B30C5F|nr:AraC family transcriptional regulator [Coraliomargarita parva]